jgi:hypothetical protein
VPRCSFECDCTQTFVVRRQDRDIRRSVNARHVVQMTSFEERFWCRDLDPMGNSEVVNVSQKLFEIFFMALRGVPRISPLTGNSSGSIANVSTSSVSHFRGINRAGVIHRSSLFPRPRRRRVPSRSPDSKTSQWTQLDIKRSLPGSTRSCRPHSSKPAET